MKFVSIKDQNISATFESALFDGLAKDGGLYMPQHIPQFSKQEIADLSNASFKEVAKVTLTKWLKDEIPSHDLEVIINNAFNFDIPIVEVGPYKVLELFHGPTMAFKDVAARFLAQTIKYFAQKRNTVINIVIATSGDTGGAVANAFGGLQNIKVFVLYPKAGISKLQKDQLTRCKQNIESIEIDGSFDDCQSIVKEALNDQTLNIPLSSANSINIGRLLPQSTYYVYSAIKIGTYEAVIPTGNLGNATAALLAHKMDLGPKHITLVNNDNDAIYRYSNTGKLSPAQTIKTISNAMDVGNPNNFLRFSKLNNDSLREFNHLADVFSIDDETTIKTLKDVYKKHGYLIDPHTAVAWAGAEASKSKLQKLIVSTASPIKFSDEVKKLTGIIIDNQKELDLLHKTKSRYTCISNSYTDFKKFLKANAIF